MSLAARLDRLAAALVPADDFVAIVIVIEDEDGRWWTGETEIDRATIDPRTQVVVLRKRPDDPQ